MTFAPTFQTKPFGTPRSRASRGILAMGRHGAEEVAGRPGLDLLGRNAGVAAIAAGSDATAT